VPLLRTFVGSSALTVNPTARRSIGRVESGLRAGRPASDDLALTRRSGRVIADAGSSPLATSVNRKVFGNANGSPYDDTCAVVPRREDRPGLAEARAKAEDRGPAADETAPPTDLSVPPTGGAGVQPSAVVIVSAGGRKQAGLRVDDSVVSPPSATIFAPRDGVLVANRAPRTSRSGRGSRAGVEANRLEADGIRWSAP
jgi:hypothetical protein